MLSPSGQRPEEKSHGPTLVMEAQKKKAASDSHKVFLWILHHAQSPRAGMKRLLAWRTTATAPLRLV